MKKDKMSLAEYLLFARPNEKVRKSLAKVFTKYHGAITEIGIINDDLISVSCDASNESTKDYAVVIDVVIMNKHDGKIVDIKTVSEKGVKPVM